MADAQAQNQELANYARPPVVEVAYGVKFAPLKGWKVPYFGLFWQRIFAEFPRCEQVPPISPSELLDPTTGLPVPRVWLIGPADDSLVQLQQGRFLFNWRRREGAGPYPRYEPLSERFFRLFQEFQRFVADNELGEIEIQEYELTYVNHIPEQGDWKLPDSIGRIIEHMSWNKKTYAFLPPPSTVGWQARFDFADGPGTLRAKLNSARHTKELKEMIVLELSARGLPTAAPLDGMRGWFSLAHRWIVRGFEDLTSDEAQRDLWGKL